MTKEQIDILDTLTQAAHSVHHDAELTPDQAATLETKILNLKSSLEAQYKNSTAI